MKKHLSKTITIIFIAILLASCSMAETIQPSPTVGKTSTPLVLPSPIPTLSSPTSTPITLGESSLACVPNTVMEGWETSPNGKWMTAGFYSDEKGNILEVVSLDCLKKWNIYLSDYKSEWSNAPHDDIIPYHWSKDGKFLYAIVGQRFSGCCWLGLRYVLLARLDLETGKQIDILNSGSHTGYHFDLTISDNDRYIIFTPPQEQSYEFAVLDLLTSETKEYTTQFSGDIDVVYAIISPNGNNIVLPLYKNIEFNDYFINSIALVDLTTGNQEILISGLTQEEPLYPVHWSDESHVVLSNTDPVFNQDNPSLVEYWILNTITREIEKQGKP